ncbi:MAG: hypothetical protein H6737_13965 [Alphaproteobacteria bacterium]|nr:hypothetical protein [Alphaproteobacteria bacterium]
MIALLHAVGRGDPVDPPSAHPTSAPTDEALDALVMRALQHDLAERFPTAAELAEALGAWLDGARRRESALGLVRQAEAAMAEAVALRAEAGQRREVGRGLLARGRDVEAEDAKAGAWAELDGATAVDARAQRRDLEADQLLHAALRIAPDLAEAHAHLLERATRGPRGRRSCARPRGDRAARARHPHPRPSAA